jgi:hypothetical protein
MPETNILKHRSSHGTDEGAIVIWVARCKISFKYLGKSSFLYEPTLKLGLGRLDPLESFSANLPILLQKHEIVIPRKFSFCRLRLTPVAAVRIGEIRDEKAFSVSS